jgi:hypothetical protein
MKRYLGHITLIVAFIFLFAITGSVFSHSWYDTWCCSDRDCAEVTAREETGHGDLIVTSKHGTVTISPTMQRLPSQDGKEHVCIRSDEDGKKHAICYYAPGGA